MEYNVYVEDYDNKTTHEKFTDRDKAQTRFKELAFGNDNTFSWVTLTEVKDGKVISAQTVTTGNSKEYLHKVIRNDSVYEDGKLVKFMVTAENCKGRMTMSDTNITYIEEQLSKIMVKDKEFSLSPEAFNNSYVIGIKLSESHKTMTNMYMSKSFMIGGAWYDR